MYSKSHKAHEFGDYPKMTTQYKEVRHTPAIPKSSKSKAKKKVE